jgi:hypothetical protein
MMAGLGRNIALTIGDLGWRIESGMEAPVRTLLDAVDPLPLAAAVMMALAVGVVVTLAGLTVFRGAR